MVSMSRFLLLPREFIVKVVLLDQFLTFFLNCKVITKALFFFVNKLIIVLLRVSDLL